MRLFSIIIDWMHAMGLGVLQYTLGNSLDLLFIRIRGVRSRRWPFCQAIKTLIKTASRMCGGKEKPDQQAHIRNVSTRQVETALLEMQCGSLQALVAVDSGYLQGHGASRRRVGSVAFANAYALQFNVHGALQVERHRIHGSSRLDGTTWSHILNPVPRASQYIASTMKLYSHMWKRKP